MASVLDYILPGIASGNPMQTFLQSLGVAPAPQGAATAPPSPVQQVQTQAPEQPVQPAMDPTQVPAVAPSTAPALAPVQPDASQVPPPPPPGAPITIDGDRWKPKHTTVLGTIADVLMGAPLFHNQTKKQNLISAMHGFADNPLRALQRVEQLDPKLAYNMWNIYQDNQRANQSQAITQQNEQDRETDRVTGIVSSLMGAAKPNNWTKAVALSKAFAEKNKVTLPFDIPDNYDQDFVDLMHGAGIKPVDQDRLKETQSYHAQQLSLDSERVQNSQQYQAARLAQHNAELAETTRHHTVDEQISSAGEAKRADKSGKTSTSFLKTKYGPGEVSPDGGKMRVKGPDNQMHLYIKTAPNQWKLVK